VAGDLRRQRLEAWMAFARRHHDGYLYCFRGGLRSQTVQQWLRDEGIDYPLVIGGYKAMRRYLIDTLEQSVGRSDLVLIAGKTGSGKTRVIEALATSIDLEGLARHRGSSFGGLLDPQPGQIDFENQLAIAMLKRLHGGTSRLYVEDEGHLIGRLSLPAVLRDRMRNAPMAVVEEPLASRVATVLGDYIIDLGERYRRRYGEAGTERHRDQLLGGLQRIRKRLGGERYALLSGMMTRAFEDQWQRGDVAGHCEWIAALLEQYYDPMYEYQLSQRSGRRLFGGTRDAVIDWARENA
jgi:tRNA 2-selenouridine synthase